MEFRPRMAPPSLFFSLSLSPLLSVSLSLCPMSPSLLVSLTYSSEPVAASGQCLEENIGNIPNVSHVCFGEPVAAEKIKSVEIIENGRVFTVVFHGCP